MSMDYISVEFKVVSPLENILKRAQDISLKRLNTKLRKATQIIESRLPPALELAIKQSEMYFDLCTEYLSPFHGQIGINDIQQRLDAIIKHWAYNNVLDPRPFRYTSSGITGGLTFKAIKANYSDVLSFPEAIATVGSQKGQSHNLEWLRWLLVEGPGYIIRDYEYYQDDKTPQYSRTGLGIMKQVEGSGWRIPDEYIGSQDNNFLTRQLDKTLGLISADILKRIGKL